MAIGTQTQITGIRTTTATGAAENLKVRDVEKYITKLPPYLTPIEDFFFTNPMQNELTTGDRGKKEWYEDAFLPDVTTLTAAITTGATPTATVASAIFRTYDTILLEETGEIASCTAVSTTTLTLARNSASNLSGVSSGTRVQRLVPAWIENGSKQSAMTVLPVQKYCWPQIMKQGLSMTGRQQASKQYGGDDWGYQWPKAGQELRERMEAMFLYNTDSYDDTTGAVGKTYSAGLGSLTTNTSTYSGTCDKAELDAHITKTAEAGKSAHLILMAGGTLLTNINSWMDARYTISQAGGALNVQQFGILTAIGPDKPHFVRYQHPICIVDIMWNPQLKGPNYATMGYLIKPKNLKKIYVGPDKNGPRKYRVEMGIQTPGADSYDAQYLIDQGLMIKLEESHGKLIKA